MIEKTAATSETSGFPVKTPRPLIEIDQVSKVYRARTGPVTALEEVSFDVNEGEFIAVLGPSGCGKSTLMMIIAGLLEASSGRVRVGETIVTRPYTDLGIVFQNHVLLEWRTALQNILFQAEMRHLPRSEYEPRARELIASVSLDGFEDKYPHELSGGMRQRVAICRALLHNPPLLLMDEPFGALDALTREQLRIDLEKLWLSSRKTVLFITHSVHEAVQLADRVIVMTPRPGRIYQILSVEMPRPRYEGAVASDTFARLTKEINNTFLKQGVLRT
jgi:NitT/TauT family transport system ATP-binding protein